MIKKQLTSGRVQVVVGIVLLIGLIMQCQRALSTRAGRSEDTPVVPEPARPGPGAAFASPPAGFATGEESLETLAARNPLAFVQMAMDRYDRSIRDYTCTFAKKELIGGKLSTDQVMHAWFREKPFSVRLEWKQNPDKVSRVLYVADRWIEKGQQMAVVEPAGSIAQLFVSYVMRPIAGDEARRSSRRTIDQFGLRNSLFLTLKYAKLAQEQKVLDFSYKGNSEMINRPTLVFERRLPYAGESGPWPDRVLIVHLDRELLVPVLCVAYGDDDRKVLLGRYQCTDIKLNPNLPDSVFTREGMGL